MGQRVADIFCQDQDEIRNMQVRIISVGRLKSGPERELVSRYLDRFQKAGRAVGITNVESVELPESRAATESLRREQEADAIRRALGKTDAWLVLDERGKDQTSETFAKALRARIDQSTGQFALVIGGADGLSAELRSEANGTICFGKLTWPHQIVRILLCEQLYRAVTIMTGHPYHRSG